MSRTPYRRIPRTGRELHRAWLQLVDTDGPFLSIPALMGVKTWSTGMGDLSDTQLATLKAAKPVFEESWDAWDRSPDTNLDSYREARDTWVTTVLRDVFRWGDHYVTGQDAPTPVVVHSPTQTASAQSTGAFFHDDETHALVWVIDPVSSLRDVLDTEWATTAIDRMELMLRKADVRVGVVTDGRWWGLVHARPGVMAASGIVDSQTWIEEPATRDAFAQLLAPIRLVGGRAEDRLPALFQTSETAAEEITEALGSQVRRAVELLVQSFSETARAAQRRGEPNPLPNDPDDIYAAAVTVMMRVVFLLFAEERDLLPQGHLFDQGYGLTGQLKTLRQRESEDSSESLDATSGTWHRLLATSRALFHGATFEDLRLPAYGGSLFDPDRFPFLSKLDSNGALALPVSDLVMMHVLDAVQMAHIDKQSARQISFRDIDVEQIGYIYEGLLGYTCRVADETWIGLKGKTSGAEPEIPLSVLNDLADEYADDQQLAVQIRIWAKEHQPAAEPLTTNALAKALTAGDTMEDADLALRAVTPDPDLRAELRTWIGAIRRDLRNRPTVFQKGDLLVVETPSRKNAGAHYTPRSLAEEVVLHALEPLVYSPGPYQTPDRTEWRLKSPEEILDLKVADIACGSGAFLVAAARFLAARLVEAWAENDIGVGSPQEQEVAALREVVAKCLYGADINPMAIEMCKLSLWLVSLEPKLPFSFVDDKVLVGDSLLGVTNLEQLRKLHIDPTRIKSEQTLFQVTSSNIATNVDVDDILKKAKRIRKALANPVDNTDAMRSAHAKNQQLERFRETTAQLRDIADGVVAAGLRLGGKPGRALDEAYDNLRIAITDAYPLEGRADRTMLDTILDTGLTPTVETDYERWQPLHWAIEVPDVLERGGFDAIIGNPPFLGGKKISPAMGENQRKWQSNVISNGEGNADLVAYFFLRALALLHLHGSLGLIATNTIAQGDTRKVGLDRMVNEGFTITRSIQSRKWPAATANLEYAAVWGSRTKITDSVPCVSDDVEVKGISTLLEAQGSVVGHPVRLLDNTDIAFQGCIALGMGFIIEPTKAREWISKDPRNADVLFPYLNGDDLNALPDQSASRWVVDFNELPQEEAKTYPSPWLHLSQKVHPQRAKKDPDKYPRMVNEWWKFWNSRPAMRKAIADLNEMLVIARVSKTVMPARVTTGQVPSDATVVFATGSYAQQAILSSSLHQLWAITRGSGMRNDPRYTPTDVFETFPRPAETDQLDKLGRILDTERREIMLRRNLGLTKLYNLVNAPELLSVSDPDVARLREIHEQLDHAVMAAYGWDDVPLDHGFHTYRKMTRWTVSPTARVEILDRLLEENHRRAALQEESGVSDPEDEDGVDQ